MQTRSQTIYSDRYVVNTVAPVNIEPTCKWAQDNSMSPTAWSAGTVEDRYDQAMLVLIMLFTEFCNYLSNEQEVIIG